ncbi:hypothetical protein GF338_03120 [candidate division WOR-3 bacterium]|nr:hypothetical protein [candidate division WOR-3 bacterium]
MHSIKRRSQVPKVIGLIGSPKGARSNSRVISDYLLSKLEEKGFEAETILVYPEHRKDPQIKGLIDKLDKADLIALVFPLYIDSLPARLIRALELISKHRKTRKVSKDQRFMAICQSGFPESHQNNLALDMCRCFAGLSGFRWIGGLPIGAGAIAGEQNLEEAGGRVYFIRNALNIAVEAISQGKEIPEEAKQAAAKLPIPAGLYRLIGNLSWKRRAKPYGHRKRDLHAQPYLEGSGDYHM